MRLRFAVPVAAAIVLLAVWGTANLYRTANAAERASIVAPVGDYYAAKARLTADLSIDDFWMSDPDLARGYDLRNGVNLEPLFAKSMQELKAANYRTELERYEPIRVYVRGDRAVVLVHGLEQWDNANGGPTSGEFATVLSLRNTDGRWAVVSTDDRMMGEPPPAEPPHLP